MRGSRSRGVRAAGSFGSRFGFSAVAVFVVFAARADLAGAFFVARDVRAFFVVCVFLLMNTSLVRTFALVAREVKADRPGIEDSQGFQPSGDLP